MSLGKRLENYGRTQRKAESSPGLALLTDAASMLVAELSQPSGTAESHGLIAEAALEARGTRAALAHSSATRTVVTQTVDTTTVYGEEVGREKLDRKESLMPAETGFAKGLGNGVAKRLDFMLFDPLLRSLNHSSFKLEEQISKL